MKDKIKFFLGANSNMDFVSYFQQLQEQSDSMQLLILKGGPGSGKSSLMKRVLSYAEEKGHNLEIIPCASDPQSLDAVIDKTANFALMDGTAPHTQDPFLPGALHHIMYTGDLWDCEQLNKNKDEIASVSARISDYHKAAGAYIKASSILLQENRRYSAKQINRTTASKFINQALNVIGEGGSGREVKRLLSAVTVGEIKNFSRTVEALADKIYIIEDKWGSAANYILKTILSHARMKGAQIIHCPCSIMPEKTDHIIFPEIRTAFCTQSMGIIFPNGERISQDTFYTQMSDVSLMEKRFSQAGTLLDNACAMVKKAKLLHDDLEAFYVKAMDFSKTDALFENILYRFYR